MVWVIAWFRCGIDSVWMPQAHRHRWIEQTIWGQFLILLSVLALLVVNTRHLAYVLCRKLLSLTLSLKLTLVLLNRLRQSNPVRFTLLFQLGLDCLVFWLLAGIRRLSLSERRSSPILLTAERVKLKELQEFIFRLVCWRREGLFGGSEWTWAFLVILQVRGRQHFCLLPI